MISADLTHRVILSFDAQLSEDPSGRMIVSHGAAPRGVLYTLLGFVLAGLPVGVGLLLGPGIVAPWPYWLVGALLPLAFLIVGIVYLNRGLRDLCWQWHLMRIDARVMELRERRIGSPTAQSLTPGSVKLRVHPAWVTWSRGDWEGSVLVAQLPDRFLILSMHKDRAKVEAFAAKVGPGLGLAVGSSDETLEAQRVLW